MKRPPDFLSASCGLGFANVFTTALSIGRHAGQRRGSFLVDRIEFGHEGHNGVGGNRTDAFGKHELLIEFIELLVGLDMRFNVVFYFAFSFLKDGDQAQDVFA